MQGRPASAIAAIETYRGRRHQRVGEIARRIRRLPSSARLPAGLPSSRVWKLVLEESALGRRGGALNRRDA